MQLNYFPLKIEHLDRILEIEQRSFPQPWTRGMFERETVLPISHFFVAQIDERIIGYGGYWQIEAEAHLINLAVHPEVRSQGVGRRILGYLVAHMEGQKVAKIFLEVRQSNQTARKLYESFGFKVVGTRLKYYVTEDAILMEKTIDGVPGNP